MHYELSDLKIFLAVAEEGNLSRGAERSHLATSSVSLRIKRLEDAVGTQLLTRQPRGVTLTPAGHVLVEHARRCVAQLEQMNADLLPYSLGLTGHVTLFANHVAVNSFLPEDLARYFSLHPNVRITLEDRLSQDIPAAVAAGRADIGVCSLTHDHAELQFLPYRRNRLVLLAPLSSMLGRDGDIGFSACMEEPFVSPQLGTTLHTFLMSKAAAIGMRLDVRVQVSGYGAIARLVASGAGIGIVPHSALRGDNGAHFRVVELSDPWATQDIRVCVRRRPAERNEFRERLVEILCNRGSQDVGPSH